jgi:hypothetical protein
MEEQYNDTRRRRCYEAALLMKKNEIRTDRKHPLTTPEQASVLRALCPPSRVLLQVAKNPKRQKFFLGKFGIKFQAAV